MKRPKLAVEQKPRPRGSTSFSHRGSFFQHLRVDPHELFQSQLRNNASLRVSNSRDMLIMSTTACSIAALSSQAVLAQCNNGMLKLWNPTKPEGAMSFPEFTCFSKVSRVVAAENSSSSTCLIVCNDRLELVDVDRCHQSIFRATAFNNNNSNNIVVDGDVFSRGDIIIATSSGSRYIHELYDTRTEDSMISFGSRTTTTRAALSKPKTRILGDEYSRVASLLDDGTVRVYDLRKPKMELASIKVVGDVQPARWENGKVIPASGRHPCSVVTLASLAGSDMFITGAEEDGLRLWDLASMQCVEHFAKCDGKFDPQVVRGSSSRTFYAFSNELNMVCEWNCNNVFKERAKFERPAYWTREVCCGIIGHSYDGLVCGNALGQFYAWTRV